ncbi:MAG TPA: hypothetical protein VGT04_08650 [Acidobacteriaceae bacterium]|nr:hypothetical protein [Acidobacteriaceae bacterium]
MKKPGAASAALVMGICLTASGQIKRTSVPMGDALANVLSKASLLGGDAKPFHVRVVVSEPENSDSPYQGTIEEWWVSPNQWRREVTSKNGMRQTIVVVDGKKTERDEGDYFPLWLRNFVNAVFDPVPNARAWEASGASIEQLTLPNGAKSFACTRAKSKIGSGERATDAFSSLCFDEQGRLNLVVSPRYSMEFHDYRGFGKKQVAREYVDDPEPGTRLVGKVVQLEDESKAANQQALFTPLTGDEDNFRSVAVSYEQMEQLTAANPPVEWPSVPAGKTSGNLAMYISADRSGRVREAWPLNSDNARLDDAARKQVRNWKIRPATDQSGNRVQVDGGLGFSFQSKIENPFPVVTGAEISKFVSGCHYDPVLPKGVLPSGTSFKIRVSIDETGKDAGESFPGGIPWNAVQSAHLESIRCHYKQYMVNGKPTYYFIDFEFREP